MGEAWLRGVRGRGWLGLCRQELKEGWQERIGISKEKKIIHIEKEKQTFGK